VIAKYKADIEEILSHRFDLGADYWTTPGFVYFRFQFSEFV